MKTTLYTILLLVGIAIATASINDYPITSFVLICIFFIIAGATVLTEGNVK